MQITRETDNIPSWNLTDLYPAIDSKELKQDLAELEKSCLNFAAEYKDKTTKISAKELASAIATYEQISGLTGKIGAYAFLIYAENQSDPTNSAFYQNTVEQITNISQHLIFFGLELNDIDEARLQDEALINWRPWLRDLRVMKPFQLSNKEETILHQKHITSSQSWVKLFDETQADMRFDYDDKQLTNQEIFQLFASADRNIREKAAKAIEQQFVGNVKLFAMITNTIAKDKQIDDELRGFARPISSRNLCNLVEDEVIDNLINVVKANYTNLSHRFYKVKAKLLGLDIMEYWDRLAPLQEVEERYIPWAEAVEIVLKAYNDFSPKIAAIGSEFFEKGWVDAKIRPGKYAGAFACPVTPSVHPYILLNYQGKARDVMTLAHELGHGIHMVLAGKQGALMCSTPLTLAETASIFGEQVTFKMLIDREQDIEIKKSILAHKIDDTLSTITRQIAFTEYELAVHEQRKQGELSVEQLGEIWMDAQKRSLGPAFNFAENYKLFWQYVPHFIHSPFYVYSYAFANCLVNSLYAQYQNGGADFVNKYIETLEAGGSKRYDELLANFGLNAKDEQFWQSGLDVVTDLIEQFEKLVNDLAVDLS